MKYSVGPLNLAVPYYERLFNLPNVGFRTLLEAIWEWKDPRVNIIKCHADELFERDDYEAVLLVRRAGSTREHLKWYERNGIDVAMWADDFHRYLWTNDEHAALLVERFELARVIFLPYLHQFLRHKVFRRFHSKAVHVPWSVPDWIFDIDVPWDQRDSTVLLSGAVSRQYPLRRWIRGYINLTRDPLFQVLEHPNYNESLKHEIIGRAFYERVASYRASIVTTAHASRPIDYTVAKYIEVPACGTIGLMEKTPDLGELGFVDGENFISISRWNFRQRAKIAKAVEGAAVARAGRELVRRRHTHSLRIPVMLNLILSHSRLDVAARNAGTLVASEG